MSLLSTRVSAESTGGMDGTSLSASRRSYSKSSSSDDSGVDAPDFSAALKAASGGTSSDTTPQADSSDSSQNNKKDAKPQDSDSSDDSSSSPQASTSGASTSDTPAALDSSSGAAKADDPGTQDGKGKDKTDNKSKDNQTAATPDQAAMAALAAQVTAQAQTVSAPVTAAAAKNAASNSVKASPFLDAFSGVAEGFHRQEALQKGKTPTSDSREAVAQAAAASNNAPVANASQQAQTQTNDEQALPHDTKNKAAIIAQAKVQAASAQSASNPTAEPEAGVTPPGVLPQTAAADTEAAAALTAQLAPQADAKSTANSASDTLVSAAPVPLKLETAGAESAAPAQDSPAPDPQQLLDQVVMGLQGKFDAQNGKAEIQLDPPNLGPLHVSVTLANGTLTAQFQSSSEVVRDLLKNNLEKLKTVLEGQGVAVDKLAVDAPQSAAAQPGQQGQQASFGSAAHDGRSAGQYQQDPRSNQRKSGENEKFARLLNQAGQQAPIDLVA